MGMGARPSAAPLGGFASRAQGAWGRAPLPARCPPTEVLLGCFALTGDSRLRGGVPSLLWLQRYGPGWIKNIFGVKYCQSLVGAALCAARQGETVPRAPLASAASPGHAGGGGLSPEEQRCASAAAEIKLPGDTRMPWLSPPPPGDLAFPLSTRLSL